MAFGPVVDLRTERPIGFEALARFAPTPYRPPNMLFEEADAVDRLAALELLAMSAALPALAKCRHTPRCG